MLFRWLSEKKDDAHYPAFSNGPKLVFLGFPVQESNIKFKDGKLNSIYISFFNKGDSGDMAQDVFNKLVDGIDAKVTDWSEDKGVSLKKSKLNSESNIQAKVWIKTTFAITLRWSFSGNSKKDFRAENIQAEIEKFDPNDDPRKQNSIGFSRDNMVQAKALTENIKKNDNGDVYIDNVPMVDQGPKGYCVDAAVSRVLQYYGLDVSMHDIAQISNSSKDGTIIKTMLTAVKMLSSRYGVKIKEYYKEIPFSKLLSQYNNMAKREKSQVVTQSAEEENNAKHTFGETLAKINPDIYAKMRTAETAEMRGFQKNVKDTVDRGIPLLWFVYLGLVKEEKLNLQSKGGHMRLIIGYNEKDKTIIYSDSWGAAHAFKKMSYDDAWVINNGLFSLDPLK